MGLGTIGVAKKNTCFRCSGTGYCTFGSISSLDFARTDSFSIYLWVRFTQTSAGIIAGRFDSYSSNSRGWSVSTQASAIRFSLKNTNGSTNGLVMDTTAVQNDGNWHSVIVTYAGTSLASGVHIYVDGVDAPLTTQVNTLSSTTTGVFTTQSGRDIAGNNLAFTGDLGRLAVFSGVVSAGDRTVLHNGRRPAVKADVLALSGLLAFWRMGDGAVYPTIPKESAGGNDGTLTTLSASALKLYAPPYHP